MSTVKADNFTWKTGQATGQSGTNVTGDQIVYGVAKAWVNFDGTSGGSVRASFNTSSKTRNGTGDYTVTFATASADPVQWKQANCELKDFVNTSLSGGAQYEVTGVSPAASATKIGRAHV